jgi:hypothetical protein
MDKLEKRRINPLAKLATLAILVLLTFEGLVIGGIFEVDAQSVAKYAPWAYESFLRLVGEHPESAPRLAEVEEKKEEPNDAFSSGLNASGLETSAIPILIATNDAMLGTNTVLEPSVPSETELEPIPVLIPTNAPSEEVELIIPVG